MKKLLLLSAFFAFGYAGVNAQTISAAPNKDAVSVQDVNKESKDQQPAEQKEEKKEKKKHKAKKDKSCSDSKDKSCGSGKKKGCCSHDGEKKEDSK